MNNLNQLKIAKDLGKRDLRVGVSSSLLKVGSYFCRSKWGFTTVLATRTGYFPKLTMLKLADSTQSSDWPWLHNVYTSETPAKGDEYQDSKLKNASI